jgi:hypothetical protein
LFCPYCGAHITIEAEPKSPHYALAGESGVNQ